MKSWEVGEDAGTGSIPVQDRAYHRSEEGLQAPRSEGMAHGQQGAGCRKLGSDLALETSMSLCVSVRPLPLGSSVTALWVLETHQGAM